ncbi:MAG TPA: hypothetical protein VHF47_07375 [Acidimicrobiales bacterium]|nr:hypothetical protein [Acidimicrobiales bacterium]
MAPDSDLVTTLAGRCREAPGKVVVEVLRGLRRRTPELATALGGTGLSAEVVVREGGRHGLYPVVMGADGDVFLLRPEPPALATFRPHFTLQGSAEELAYVVFGETDVRRAVFSQTLVLHVEPRTLSPRYPRVMRLVAEELRAPSARRRRRARSTWLRRPPMMSIGCIRGGDRRAVRPSSAFRQKILLHCP